MNTPAPAREEWPEPPAATAGGDALTDVVLATFRLNADLMEAAQRLARAGDITAAWWQVLGGILDEPRTVSEVSRRMGMTRQGVQRVADLLVGRGLAEYRSNPAHRRAKLLASTKAGHSAIRRISVEQHPWATEIAEKVGVETLQQVHAGMQRLIAVLEASDVG